MKQSQAMNFIKPNWPAPNTVFAATTTRSGGFSAPPFDSFNLGQHVGDDSIAVNKNREQLKQSLELTCDPVWLNQTHSDIVLPAESTVTTPNADASFTQQRMLPCVVLTADCLPVLLCNQAGTEVAAVHAGWRGILNGIINNTVHAMASAPKTLIAWLGPAIGPQAFEVGPEVFELFTEQNPAFASAFTTKDKDHYLANIYELAKIQLEASGVTAVFGGDFCTVSDPTKFYSYRRDQGKTGRMASLIYLRSA